MEIREDFISVKDYLQRLIKYGEAFEENNLKRWSHLKSKENFESIYDLRIEDRNPLEKIYSCGRDCAISMSHKLMSFNDVNAYPTLTMFIKSFDGGWIYQIDYLQLISEKAKNKAKSLGSGPWAWAIEQMIILFDNQLRLLDATKTTLKMLKKTDLYKNENGKLNSDFFPKWIKNIWNAVLSNIIATVIIVIITTVGGFFFLNRTDSNNNSKQSYSTGNSINIDRSSNVTINQTQNVIKNKITNTTDNLRAALRSLDSIELYVYSSIPYEPDEYLVLLSRTESDIRNISEAHGKAYDLIKNTYYCYDESGKIWKYNSPSELLSKGFTDHSYRAKYQFEMDTVPKLYRKLEECSKYLKEAHEHLEME